jgi:hypothetical protein
MAEAGRRALIDLSGIDLTTSCLADGSVLEHALARARREQDDGGWEYASFLNRPVMGMPSGHRGEAGEREGK